MADNTNQGRGWHGDSEGHARAGREGGKKVAAERGEEFYEEIGSQGGKNSPGKFKPGDKRTEDAARKGGEARSSS